MKWECNVCGYLHEGDSAPESCPLCSAPASEFIKKEEAIEKTASAAAAEKPKEKKEEQEKTQDVKQWRCTVCGYLHEGEQAPDECPLCHVTKEKFVLAGSEEDLKIQKEKEEKRAAAQQEHEEKSIEKETEAVSVAVTSQLTKLRCTVCGYIHNGETPPEECPICGDGKEKFVPFEQEETAVEPVAKRSENGEERFWKCTVCQYIHEGEEPPAKCPICGAGAEAFVEVDASGNLLDGEEEEPVVVEKKGGFFSSIEKIILNFHLHPIMAHFPNGILPVVVIFLMIGVIWGTSFLENAAYYNLVAILISLPAVIYAGLVEWKRTYMGAKTFIFITKIICGIIAFAVVAVLVFWPLIQPGVNTLEAGRQVVVGGAAISSLWLYLGIAVLGLAAVGIAGHLGGKLVFGKRR